MCNYLARHWAQEEEVPGSNPGNDWAGCASDRFKSLAENLHLQSKHRATGSKLVGKVRWVKQARNEYVLQTAYVPRASRRESADVLLKGGRGAIIATIIIIITIIIITTTTTTTNYY